jgi:hypothetical protein
MEWCLGSSVFGVWREENHAAVLTLYKPESRIKRTLFGIHSQVFQEEPVSVHVAMAKPIVVVRVDDEPLAEPLLRAVNSGRVRVVEVDEHFQPSRVVADVGHRICLLPRA